VRRALLILALLLGCSAAFAGGPHMRAEDIDDAPATYDMGRPSATRAPAAPAAPAPAVDIEEHPAAWAKGVYDAATHKNWRFLVAFVLMAFVSIARRGSKYLPGRAGVFFLSDRGGALLAIVLAVVGGAAAALMGGGPMSVAMLGNAMMNAVIAAGGYSLVKKTDPWGLVRPLFRRRPQKKHRARARRAKEKKR
jgi:hypothetical protein